MFSNVPTSGLEMASCSDSCCSRCLGAAVILCCCVWTGLCYLKLLLSGMAVFPLYTLAGVDVHLEMQNVGYKSATEAQFRSILIRGADGDGFLPQPSSKEVCPTVGITTALRKSLIIAHADRSRSRSCSYSMLKLPYAVNDVAVLKSDRATAAIDLRCNYCCFTVSRV